MALPPGFNTSQFGSSPTSFVNGKPNLFKGQAIDPVTGGYIPPDWMFPGSAKSGGMTPAEWAIAHGNGANGGPSYNPDGSHYTRDQRMAQAGLTGWGSNGQGGAVASPEHGPRRTGGEFGSSGYILDNGGMYGTGMNRSQFAGALTTGDPTAVAAGQANAAKWNDPVFLDSYYKSILPPDQYAQWKARQANQPAPQPFNPADPFGTGSRMGNPPMQPPLPPPGYGVDQSSQSPVPPGTGGLQPPMGGGGDTGGTSTGQVGLGMSPPQGGMNNSTQPVTPPYQGIAGRMWQGGSGVTGGGNNYWSNNSGGNPR